MGVEEDAKQLNFEAVIISLIVSAFSFVAALFWRDAISETISQLIPEGEGLFYSYLVAAVVTVVGVLVIYLVSRLLKPSK